VSVELCVNIYIPITVFKWYNALFWFTQIIIFFDKSKF